MKKKILFLLTMVLVATQFTFADDDIITKDINQIPANAKSFINKNLPKETLSYIEIDKDYFGGTKYEVVFVSGLEVKFDSKGEWVDIDANKGIVPAAIVPAVVKSCVDKNFPGIGIEKIEKKRWGFEVELINDFELKVDSKGELMKVEK